MSVQGRLVLQQCVKAQLKLSDDNILKIGKGMVIFVCFMQGATCDVISKIVKTLVNVQLSEDVNGKRRSILDIPGDLLIIPQATLGGKVRGKTMQYHGNVEKELGLKLYSDLVQQVKDACAQNAAWLEGGCVVHSGSYGERQVLSMDTNGPFTHVLEF